MTDWGDPDGRCGAGGDWAEEEAALRARTDRELRRLLGFG